MEKLDMWLFSLINNTRLRRKWLDWCMLVLTNLGEGWCILILMTAIYYGFRTGGHWYVQSFVTVLAGGVVCQIVKKYFPRSRPATVLTKVNILGKRLSFGSLPSGHTATVFSLAVVFSHHWASFAPLFYMIATIIGLTRVYVGAHFPFDIFCGAVIGLVITNGIFALLKIAHSYHLHKAIFDVGGAVVFLALVIPLCGGYPVAKIRDRLKEKVGRVRAFL